MNGMTNGHAPSPDPDLGPQRFSGVPKTLDIPVGQQPEDAVEVDLADLSADPNEICSLLENEDVPNRFWITISLAYAKDEKVDTAIDVVIRGLDAVGKRNPMDKLALFNVLCWYYLHLARKAPRTRLEPSGEAEPKNKDYFLRQATGVLNDATRISPSYPPLTLARGVLQLLRSALVTDQSEKTDALRAALKSFDDSLRASQGQNMMAIIGRARVMFSMGRHGEALKGYQQALERAPDLSDPDPRIGIGCCFWALGHHEDAKVAWERALDVNPQSKIANVLLGIQTLEQTSKLSLTDPRFQELYKKAMVKFIQTAFKLDGNLPLACSTFGSYFLANKGYTSVEKLARKAVELTDISSIASDGWYLLARKEHYGKDPVRAGEHYLRADQARGGDQKGFIPAKFGSAQMRILQGDQDGAKFRLEKIIQHTKSIEAMTLLGTLWAEDAFTGRAGNTKEELIAAQRKAIPLLEAVRVAWKDPKRNVAADSSVLLNLARLYETDHPDKALQCLQQVEQMELEDVSEDVIPEDAEDESSRLAAMRVHIPPQLLNNIACFHYQAERFSEAVTLFETALNGCVRLSNQEPPVDTSALFASMSFNLGRAYEAENNLDDAKKTYEQLLERNPGYLDARMRLVNIALRHSPMDQGPELMKELYESDSQNLDVRALYGWFLRKAKKKVSDMALDSEQRHYKHSLASIDKHDRYSLTAMGNLYLSFAREMPRDTEQARDRRSRTYAKGVEFFEKALQLDPRNAYAAQGMGIAVVEDKKDHALALQIFMKARETIKEASVHINLGHTYFEVKQFARAIEAYETALTKDRHQDPQLLACLGRTHLLRGKTEKSPLSLRTSLEYSRAALAAAPDPVHFRFNVAFVQIQLAQLIHSLPESSRSLEEIDAAAQGLDEAIASFEEMSKLDHPPFPRSELEQRASMGRNTMKRQLERAATAQREYEGRNAERLLKAREAREAEIARREEERRQREGEEEERRRVVREERSRMAERDREVAEARGEEERRKVREELDRERGEGSVDEEGGGGEKRKKKPSKRKKKRDVVESDVGSEGERQGSERPRNKKKRRLVGRETKSKFKSAEFVEDEDEDGGDGVGGKGLDTTTGDPTPEAEGWGSGSGFEAEGLGGGVEAEGLGSGGEDGGEKGDVTMDEAEDQPDPESEAVGSAATPRKKASRIIDEEDEDEGDEEGGGATAVALNGNSSGVLGEEE